MNPLVLPTPRGPYSYTPILIFLFGPINSELSRHPGTKLTYIQNLGHPRTFKAIQRQEGKIFFSRFFLMFIFEREKACARWGGAEKDRETQNPKRAPGSQPSAQSPTRGLNAQTTRQ